MFHILTRFLHHVFVTVWVDIFSTINHVRAQNLTDFRFGEKYSGKMCWLERNQLLHPDPKNMTKIHVEPWGPNIKRVAVLCTRNRVVGLGCVSRNGQRKDINTRTKEFPQCTGILRLFNLFNTLMSWKTVLFKEWNRGMLIGGAWQHELCYKIYILRMGQQVSQMAFNTISFGLLVGHQIATTLAQSQ